MGTKAFGKGIDRFLHFLGWHIKLRAANALVGLDKAEVFETLQAGANGAIGAPCNFDDVFGNRGASLCLIGEDDK